MKKYKYLFFVIIITFTTVAYCSEMTELILISDKENESILVDKEIKELFFYKKRITEIKGLEKLIKLEGIVFELSSFTEDISFLQSNSEIKYLVFRDAYILKNDFLYNLNNLVEIIFQGCVIKEMLEIKKLNKIEYLEITNSNLLDIPFRSFEAPALKFINLAYNNIKTIDDKILKDIHCLLILTGNPIMLSVNHDNIITDDLDVVLPAKYKRFMR